MEPAIYFLEQIGSELVSLSVWLYFLFIMENWKYIQEVFEEEGTIEEGEALNTDLIQRVETKALCDGCVFAQGSTCWRPEHLQCYDEISDVDYIFLYNIVKILEGNYTNK